MAGNAAHLGNRCKLAPHAGISQPVGASTDCTSYRRRHGPAAHKARLMPMMAMMVPSDHRRGKKARQPADQVSIDSTPAPMMA
jgi:hypothetical protein